VVCCCIKGLDMLCWLHVQQSKRDGVMCEVVTVREWLLGTVCSFRSFMRGYYQMGDCGRLFIRAARLKGQDDPTSTHTQTEV
jgi:hypothetical protein